MRNDLVDIEIMLKQLVELQRGNLIKSSEVIIMRMSLREYFNDLLVSQLPEIDGEESELLLWTSYDEVTSLPGSLCLILDSY